LFCVVLCIVCVYMCTVLLPPGGYPIAVKCISYINIQTHTCTVLLPPGGYPIAVKYIISCRDVTCGSVFTLSCICALFIAAKWRK